MAYAISAIRYGTDGYPAEVQLHRIIDFSEPPLTLEISTVPIEQAITFAKEQRLRIHVQTSARFFVAVLEKPFGGEMLIDLPETPEARRLHNLPTF